MMTKLKVFLWFVVVCYLLYVLVMNGPSTQTLALLGMALFVGIMQVWLHSKARQKLKDKYK